jgi:hypothetical protein
VNTQTHASERSSGEKKKGSSHTALRLLATLIVLALVAWGGWWARGVHDSATKLAEVKAALDDGVKRVEGALTKQNLEEAERRLNELKTVAAKDGRIAELEARLVAAKIAKAVSDGQLDDAKRLLAKAESDGNVSSDQIKRWRDQVAAAQAQKSASATTSAAGAAPPPSN